MQKKAARRCVCLVNIEKGYNIKQPSTRVSKKLVYGGDFTAAPQPKRFSSTHIRKGTISRLKAEVLTQCLFRQAGEINDAKHFYDRTIATGEDVYVKEVSDYMGEIVRRKEIKAEQIIDELAKIAFTKTGTPFVKEGDVDANLKVNIKDKLKALDMLAKWLGLYEKDNKQKAAQTQLLQVAFIGSDKLEKVTAQNEQIVEFNKSSIWDGAMEKKSKKIKKNIGAGVDKAMRSIIESEIEKIPTPKSVVKLVADNKLLPRQK